MLEEDCQPCPRHLPIQNCIHVRALRISANRESQSERQGKIAPFAAVNLSADPCRTRPAACTAAATAPTDDSFDLGSLPIAEVLPSHNPEVVLFQHPP